MFNVREIQSYQEWNIDDTKAGSVLASSVTPSCKPLQYYIPVISGVNIGEEGKRNGGHTGYVGISLNTDRGYGRISMNIM